MSEEKIAGLFWFWIIGWLIYGIIAANLGWYPIGEKWIDENCSYAQCDYM